MELKNKRILITAGPTWVAIDKVRVISNLATGYTGIILAKKLNALGAKVTLVLGPVGGLSLKNKDIRIIRFKFFEDLEKILILELKHKKKYDVLIHSAAVSDYRPKVIYPYKVKSDLKRWQIILVPTEKLIDLIKKINPFIFRIGFKFEPDTSKDKLIKNAKLFMEKSAVDVVVANTINHNIYRAYIIYNKKIEGPYFNRLSLSEGLIKVLKII